MRILLAFLLTACGAHPPVSEGPPLDGPPATPPAKLTPPPDPAPDHPTVVFHGTHHWVIGLPPSHGWKRNDWVALSSPPDDRGTTRALGVALVLTTEAGRADAAPLALVGTVDKADLIGARARVIHTTEGEWPHVGKLLATVLEGRPAPTRVRLNIGKNDGVFQGDRYSLRRLKDNNVVPRSQVEVVEVGPTWSVAAIEDGDVVAGQALVFEPGRPATTGRKVRILVCNFQPMSGAAQSLGETFAAEFRQRLQNATRDMKRVEVLDEVATVIGDGEAGHEEARRLGRNREADLVVWGTARCHEGRGCTYPRFTLVDPEALRRTDWRADQPEFALFAEQQVAEQVVRTPEVLAAALLGFLSYQAQHHQDARQYLERALAGAVLTGHDRARALRDLGQSFYILGQPALALEVAAELEAEPHPAWAITGRYQRALLIEGQGNPDAALPLLEQCRRELETLGLRRERAATLVVIARIQLMKGATETALALHEERKKEFEALGDRHARAVTLGDIAGIHLMKGEIATALALHEEVLKEFEVLEDRRSRAITLRAIAHIRLSKGEIATALALHEEVLKEFEALGDRRSRAAALSDIARIRSKGDVATALALHEEVLREFEALGDRRSRAVTLGDIALIRKDRDEIDTALALHEEALREFEALGDRRSRAVTLSNIARIRTDRGEIDIALALHEEVLKEFEALGDRHARAMTLGNIARIRRSKEDIDTALALHEEVLKEFETLGDRRAHAATLDEIARIRTDKGHLDTALALREEELREYEVLKDRRSRAITLGDIARIHLMKGDTKAAAERQRERLAVYEAMGDPEGIVAALAELADSLIAGSQVDEARTHLARAWPLAQRGGQPALVGPVGYLHGDLLLKSGAPAEAVSVLEAAVAAFRQMGRTNELQVVEQALAAARAAAGR
jgi:tetratricopeptide (TPR) repeat protein